MIHLDIFLGLQEERARYLVVGRLAMNIARDAQTRASWQAVRRGERSLLEGPKTANPFGPFLCVAALGARSLGREFRGWVLT